MQLFANAIKASENFLGWTRKNQIASVCVCMCIEWVLSADGKYQKMSIVVKYSFVIRYGL